MKGGPSRTRRGASSTCKTFVMEMAEDKKAILAAQNGNIGAFHRLVFQFDADILGLAMRIAASEQDARRLYRETMLRIYEELPGFQFECPFHNWVGRHFSTVSLNYLKRKRVARPDAIEAALDALLPRERMAVELKHYQWDSLQTIGEMLGTTEKAAGKALVRGIRKLGTKSNEHNPANS